jgi:hypothetical protein
MAGNELVASPWALRLDKLQSKATGNNQIIFMQRGPKHHRPNKINPGNTEIAGTFNHF